MRIPIVKCYESVKCYATQCCGNCTQEVPNPHGVEQGGQKRLPGDDMTVEYGNMGKNQPTPY